MLIQEHVLLGKITVTSLRDLLSSTDNDWTFIMSLNSFALFTCCKCWNKLLLWVLCCWYVFCVCVPVWVAGLTFFYCRHRLCMQTRSLCKVSDHLSILLFCFFLSFDMNQTISSRAYSTCSLTSHRCVYLSLKLKVESPVRYVGWKGCKPTGSVTTSKNEFMSGGDHTNLPHLFTPQWFHM